MTLPALFDRDLRFANEQRKRLDKYFYPKVARDGMFVALDRSPGSLYIQRNCHVDCIVASKKGGSVAIEEKIVRWKGRDYTAITVETHSNLERTRETVGDGWIYTSVADYLLYAFQRQDGKLRVNIFSLPKLRSWFVTCADSFHVVDTPNKFYTTRCALVDLSRIPDEIYTLRDGII